MLVKRKHTAQSDTVRRNVGESGFFNLRASITLLVCTAAGCSVLAGALLPLFRPEKQMNVSHRTLTFAQRVAYQRAIEEVYWRHRIWPRNGGERPDPRPSLDAVMSQAQLERKVRDYLRESQALENYWQRPITAEQLQGEMDRMAQHTKQPEVLREVFAALGDDPLVIAECLARPTLADHLFQSAMASQDATWTVSQPINSHKRHGASPTGYRLPTITTVLGPEGTCIDAWGATSTVNAPTARDSHTAVWTGSEMIVWGGADSTNTFNTGGRYSPSTDSWTATSIANAPSARLGHTAVWTGSEMIVWGGLQVFPNLFNTGGRYNPATDTWTATSITNAPPGRTLHTAVWNGSEMIVWGGESSAGYLNTGGRYNPSTDSWGATNTTNAPDARATHTAVWTGNEMIIWGGVSDSGYLNTGGRYNPGTDSWVATRTTGAPFPRNDHTTVWTGIEMIIWGGNTNTPPYYLNTGGRYNPITDSWVATNTTNAPSARGFHTTIWTASDMIVWGGFVGSYPPTNTGGRYRPSTDSWTATSTANAPAGRSDHTAVWTGSEMIVWGGEYSNGQNNQYLNTGGRYCGQYPTPTPTPTATPTAIIEVTNTNDSGPGSLRQALADANDGDIIGFAVTGTIGLTSGELVVNHSITISGPGPENLAVNGNAMSRVFHIASGQTVTISGLTITNGHASDSGGGIYNDHAVLTLSNCVVTGNSAAFSIGGGIHNDGKNIGRALLQINNCLITNNSGGIYNDALQAGAATLVITYSTLSNNSPGEAINNDGWSCTFCGNGTTSIQITNSSIKNNPGGAIYSDTGRQNCGGSCPITVSITNSTISGNGGGVHNSTLSDTVVSNSTISDNGSGIYNDNGALATSVYNTTMSNNGVEIRNFNAPVVVAMSHTIFNVSPGGHSILNDFGTVTSDGYNVSSDDGGGYLNSPGDQINTDPMLGPLQDNGGPTLTHALLPGSPAINAGDPNFVGPPDYDQRGPGYDRVRNGRIDIGSFEVQEPLPTPTPTATPTGTPRATPTPRFNPTPRSRPSPPPRP
jgi:N-acetylneuraminic acid mutarotase